MITSVHDTAVNVCFGESENEDNIILLYSRSCIHVPLDSINYVKY